MPKAVCWHCAVAHRNQKLQGNRLAQRLGQSDRAEVRGGGQQLVIDRAAGGRRHGNDPMSLFGECGQTPEEDVPELLRDLVGTPDRA